MITAIGDVMRALYERNWITTRDGNASLRRSKSNILYITPSGWRKNIIHPEHIVKLKFREDKTLEVPEGSAPSGELHMHYLLQKDITKTRSVLHAHPTATVGCIYRGFDLQKLCTQFPEIFRYTKVGPSVPFLPATSVELGEATAQAFHLDNGKIDFDIVGQANHGVTAVARDCWSAFEHLERLEHVCRIVLDSGVSPLEVNSRV